VADDESALPPQLYLFTLGGSLLIECTIHVRHLRNLFLFRAILADNGIAGRIEYARPIMLRLSAEEFFAFAAAYAIIFLVTESWFVFGGVMTCVSTGINHRTLARRYIDAGASGAETLAVRELL
jgi:hypothetical protein